ncbi:lipopolysaccharide biosynthesis protein [Pseudooceanicola sp. CBS1P-1]|uniref:Lipopolysaccharide biosynthesis protein n=1 Tax=Pseudooceanicola albus TaxID=2692189 RepID=A0A6L7G9P8_9RHOB|nr:MULTISPECIES: lipopolysaccharide biosynthesis protein [Pseudooceanicola]MBT9386742.1 lipopolysaccharide biosynthesis protein [Pseudooceanicola endophyticus]MXN20775.1 lipopolysaccharide biosynthesis protein [Pseudooceanicola albus]
MASPLMRRLLRGGIMALIIKVGAAGFQFLMFLMLARAMGKAEYGLFGFGFSLATLLAVGGSFGQRMLSLRFLGIYASEDKPLLAAGVIRNGFRIVVGGTAVVSLLCALVLPVFKPGLDIGFLLLTGVFAIILALAEYFSFVLRSYGGMTLSLAPRDVIWRALVTLAALPFAFGLLPQMNAAWGMVMITVLLFICIFGQTLMHAATRPHALLRAPAQYEHKRWLQAAWGLWGTSFVQIAAPNLTIVILGLLLSPEETGPVFAALRIAALLNLFLLAANMVASPLISRFYHEKKFADLQRTCTAIAVLSSVTAGLIFVLLMFEGRFFLNLFGPGFAMAHPELVIVAAAYVVNTLTGPTSALLELSGHERAAFRMITITNVIAMAAMPFATWSFGSVGAACCLAFSIIGWNVQAVVYARRNVGVDPSVFGLFYKGRGA